MPAVLLLTWIFDRIREPSTHAGVAAVAQASTYFVPPHWAPVLHALTGLFGALAVAVTEGNATKS